MKKAENKEKLSQKWPKNGCKAEKALTYTWTQVTAPIAMTKGMTDWPLKSPTDVH